MKLLYTLLFISISFYLSAQNGISINTTANPPDQSAMLDVQSTSKGMLVPRLTTAQRTMISSPASGLLVFDNTTQSFWFYNAGWTELVDSGNTPWEKDGDTLSTPMTLVGIGTSSPSRMLNLNFNNSNVNTSQFLIEQQGTGDSWFNIGLTGSTHYALGIDNSDGDKFKIGYNATSPGPLHVTPRLTIDAEGDIGIGSSIMAERLVVNSAAAQDPFRADVNGVAKFKLFANGGATIGGSVTPPANGLHVTGSLNPAGGISSTGNIAFNSSAGFISITAGDAEIRIYSTGQIDITSANSLNITSANSLNISSTGALTLSGNSVDITSNSSVNIESQGGMVLDAGTSLDITSQNSMDIQNSSSTMNVKNLGGVLNVQAATILNLDGATVDINNGTQGAARVGDPVAGGVIILGSSSVKIGN